MYVVIPNFHNNIINLFSSDYEEIIRSVIAILHKSLLSCQWRLEYIQCIFSKGVKSPPPNVHPGCDVKLLTLPGFLNYTF